MAILEKTQRLHVAKWTQFAFLGLIMVLALILVSNMPAYACSGNDTDIVERGCLRTSQPYKEKQDLIAQMTADANETLNRSYANCSTYRDGDEFRFSFVSSLASPDLVARIEAMPVGTAAKVLIDGKGILVKEAFDAIRGQDKTLVCCKNDIQWVFNGIDIKEKSKDVNLGVGIKMVDASELDSDTDAVLLSFVSNGILPGKAQIRFKSDYLYEYREREEELGLYRLEDGWKIEQEPTDFDLEFDGVDKWCYMDILHNSRFLISPEKLKSIKMKNAKVIGVKSGYRYKGSAIKPSVKIRIAGITLKKNRDYKINYGNNTEVGKGTIKITGKGKYKKCGKCTLRFNINPKGTSIRKSKKGDGFFAIAWKKQANQTRGYQFQYSTDNTFTTDVETRTIKNPSRTSAKIYNVKSKTVYYVRARTYQQVKKTKYYSEWSRVRKIVTR